jgi:hypothetical protein
MKENEEGEEGNGGAVCGEGRRVRVRSRAPGGGLKGEEAVVLIGKEATWRNTVHAVQR